MIYLDNAATTLRKPPCVAEAADVPAPDKKRGLLFYLATIVITFLSAAGLICMFGFAKLI